MDFVLSRPSNPTRRYLLLHGYAERGEKMFNRVASLIPYEGEIIAPNGPFPLPGRFPLSEEREGQQFVKSFAWYFYDRATRRFFIDYSIPARLLGNLLQQENDHLPVTIIGYSQGGYLSLFAAGEIPRCDHIIGINGSWRDDKLPPNTSLNLRIDSINGEQDAIVDPQQAKEGHQRLIARGARGGFYSIPREEHRWGEGFVGKLKELIASKTLGAGHLGPD